MIAPTRPRPKPVGPAAVTVPPQRRRDRPPERLDPRAACPLLAEAGGPAFWQRIARVGTPLVDPIPGDDTHRAVTFLVRSADATEVLLFVNKLADATAYERSRMERLPGTDVWALTYRLGRDWRGSYTVAVLVPGAAPRVQRADAELIEMRRERATAVADPADRPSLHRWFTAMLHAGPDPLAREQLDETTSVASLPDAPPPAWPQPLPAGPAGVVHRGVLAGREVWLHDPAGIDPAVPLPVLVLLDGQHWAGLPAILDALFATGRVPPLRTIGVSSGDFVTRTRELSCDDAFVAWLAGDLLGWACEHARLTVDPARTIVAGQSLGGLTALYAAHTAPHRFGCALSQSGSFWWPNPAGGADAEWLTDVVPFGPRTHGVHLEVGTDEWVLLGPTRRMRDALRARGDALTYREYNGGHDQACWRVGLADGLIALTAAW
ncbi:enterochelin esterase [Pseudonocardia thermophila]|uniref:Enterochelin esterase n=1 Tax=Pseudonocardia thermophila TaxID=1848 RepID=A0A1M7ANI7_PSETH|nr:enterochelin esterase [Pseudonocardia thermophila]SHL44353.1 enterochelin esterase [Pseudonocardia thermophila]